MWKESYRIGIDAIDRQHRALFGMVEGLLKAIREKAGKAQYERAVAFMKEYVVKHFSAEEAYQEAVHYSGIEEHKKLHRACTASVLEYEKKMIETDYDIRVLKDFAGMLTAWLIYHVASEDQKIAGRDARKAGAGESLAEYFSRSAENVLAKLAGEEAGKTERRGISEDPVRGDVYVSVGLSGGVNGKAVYAYSKDFAFRVMKCMTMMEPPCLDGLVCSALSEISNIISSSAAGDLVNKGLKLSVGVPAIAMSAGEAGLGAEGETMLIITGMGDFKITLRED